jgi:hypothetical protein
MNYERENFTPQEAARANPKNLGFLGFAFVGKGHGRLFPQETERRGFRQ